MMTKPPSSLPFLSLPLFQHATCDVQGPRRLKGVKPLGTPVAGRGLRCSWKSDPVRGAEGQRVNNSRASFPESQNFRREAAHEDKTDHSEPTGNGAQMQPGQKYRLLVC